MYGLFKHLPHQCRLLNKEKNKTVSLLQMQANKKLVQSVLVQETAKSVTLTLHDLLNILVVQNEKST